MSDAHVDLLRADPAQGLLESVARVYILDDGYGCIVKDASSEHYEGNVAAVLTSTLSMKGTEVVEALSRAFRGPYLYVSVPHRDHECGAVVDSAQFERRKVEPGTPVLPALS